MLFVDAVGMSGTRTILREYVEMKRRLQKKRKQDRNVLLLL